MMLWNLLSESPSSDSGNGGGGCAGSPWVILVFVAVVVLFLIWNRRSQKKREQEINDTLDAIQPGNKVKTIGGICGIVVEICPEDNTFILETGSETSGKSYLKFDKKAVYQTDAVPSREERAVEEPANGEAPIEEEPVFEETAPIEAAEEAPVEETKDAVEETSAEETEE